MRSYVQEAIDRLDLLAQSHQATTDGQRLPVIHIRRGVIVDLDEQAMGYPY
jgi:hypothetical protein